MQNTLLGIAIAIILVLVAALVGPLLIDWGNRRSLFEAEASRLIGADVRVTGPIEARLLPTPSLTLHDIEIGSDNNTAIRARQLGIEFALGPLMRGEWQASNVHLVGPQLTLALDASGHLRTPKVAVGFRPGTLSIEHLSIEDGTLTLNDAANGARATLEGFWFNGEARSLLGPWKGEGAASAGGDLYPFRLSTGRATGDGALKLHVNVDPVNHPLSVVADGTLTIKDAEPNFEGTLNLMRPVGIAARGAATSDALSLPWRLSGKVKATSASALFQQFEFQYGSDEQGLKLTGVADFTFGKHPSFNGVLSGRQIDLDRALAASDGTRPPPAAAIRKIAQLAGGAFRPSMPIQIGVGIDQVTLGGDTISNLRGDISTDGGGWNLDRFEFRAPGFTQVKLSGHLAVKGDGVSFSGPAELEATDPKLLAAWLEGRTGTVKGDLQPLKLRGDVTFGTDKIAIDRLQASFDRKTVTGRLAYIFAGGRRAAKLDATLNAAELDIDAAMAFGRALMAGSAVARPQDMTIAADIGRAELAGFVANDASARVQIDGNGIQIDRLSVGDFGGARFSASGRIDTAGHAPRGSLVLDLDSGQTAAVAALMKKVAPGAAKSAGRLLERVDRAKLHATISLADGKQSSATVAEAAIAGTLDAMNVNVRASLRGDWQKPSSADMRIDGTVSAPHSEALVKLMGLDRYAAVGNGAGELKLAIAGPEDHDQSIDVRLTADGLAAEGTGKGRLSLLDGLQLNAALNVSKADLRPLRPVAQPEQAEPLPLILKSRVTMANHAIAFDDISAHLGGSTVRGKVALDSGKISGALETDRLDGAPLIAAAIGMPSAARKNDAAWGWSSEPFSGGLFGDRTGEVTLKARQVALLPNLTALEFQGTLRVTPQDVALDGITASVSGGRLTGALSFGSRQDGVKALARLSLAGADAATLLPAAVRPPVSGTLDVSVDVEGAGLSPVALIGSLHGNGKIALADAQLAGLDPRAFDAVTRAVDQGLPIDAVRISDTVNKALDSGSLPIKHVESALAVTAGQVRVGKTTIDAEDAALSFAGGLDLTNGSLDARLVLSGGKQVAGTRPDIFMALKGPLPSPKRSIDVSALTGWLTLRAVDHQTRQIREFENAERQTPALKPKSDLAPALPAPVEIKRLPALKRRGLPEASANGAQN